MGIRRSTFAGLVALMLASAASAQDHKYDFWDENYTVQGLLGAVHYDGLKLRVSDSAAPRTINHSTLPQLGGAWTTLPRGERFQYGLETSLLLAFQFENLNYLLAGGSGLYVRVSTSMWIFDLSGGAYASWFVDPQRKVRVYAGAGPLMMYADYRADRNFDNDSLDEEINESAFGLGLYARTGIELRMQEYGMLGIGARGTWTDIDLTEIGGPSDLSGAALFITYTAGF